MQLVLQDFYLTVGLFILLECVRHGLLVLFLHGLNDRGSRCTFLLRFLQFVMVILFDLLCLLNLGELFFIRGYVDLPLDLLIEPPLHLLEQLGI